MNIKEINATIIGIVTISMILFIASTSFTDAQKQGTLGNERINLSIDNVSFGITDTGLIYVNGTVLNNSTHTAESVIVDVNLFDIHNRLINGESRFVMPPESVLRPGSSTDFFFTVIAEDAHRYNISSYAIKEYVPGFR